MNRFWTIILIIIDLIFITWFGLETYIYFGEAISLFFFALFIGYLYIFYDDFKTFINQNKEVKK